MKMRAALAARADERVLVLAMLRDPRLAVVERCVMVVSYLMAELRGDPRLVEAEEIAAWLGVDVDVVRAALPRIAEVTGVVVEVRA